MDQIVIFGTGKMAELAHLYFTKDQAFDVVAFCVDEQHKGDQTIFRNLPLVSFETVEKQYPPNEFKMFVAIGYTKLNALRKEKYFAAKSKGYTLVSYACQRSIIWDDVTFGDNCFIFENQVMQPHVQIGNNVIIWSGNHFGHDVQIGDHSFIASHCVLSGGVQIGKSNFVGVNATFRDAISTGDHCIIGAGVILLNHAKEKSVYIAESTKPYPIDSEKFEKIMDITRKQMNSSI